MVHNQDHIQILLLEDDEDDRLLFKSVLKDVYPQASLIIAEDGEALMKVLSTFPSSPPPHLIFLDINLPGLDGIECLMKIRHNKKNDHVPVFMLTTSQSRVDIDLAYGNGANLYIPKALFFLEDKHFVEELFSIPLRNFLSKIPKEKFFMTRHTDLAHIYAGHTIL